jgi:hypothetical protein
VSAGGRWPSGPDRCTADRRDHHDRGAVVRRSRRCERPAARLSPPGRTIARGCDRRPGVNGIAGGTSGTGGTGSITYSPAHLDERLSILRLSLDALRREHAALREGLARLAGAAGSAPAPLVERLSSPPPELAVRPGTESGTFRVAAQPAGATPAALRVTDGRLDRAAPPTGAASPVEATWHGGELSETPIVTAEWTAAGAPFHWFASVPLPVQTARPANAP